MILSDKTIKILITNGQLVKEPIDETQVQPPSLDFRLGNTFSVINSDFSNTIKVTDTIKYITVTTDTFTIKPGQFVLATTMESIKLPLNIGAFIQSKSSIGRLGLSIQNSGWCCPGTQGQITLELFNASNVSIKLEAGMRIGQLIFVDVDRPVDNPYDVRYHGQTTITPEIEDGIEYVCESVNTDTSALNNKCYRESMMKKFNAIK